MASIEGRRGEPRPRPPFPAVSGLVGQADQHQQRQELRHDPADHRQRGQVVQRASAARSRPARRCSR